MPKTGRFPRSMKAANAPMKSFITPKTNFSDVYVTVVPEISVAISIKDTSPPGLSFLFNHMENSMMKKPIVVLFLTNGETMHSWTGRHLEVIM
jgi:hypothetical protein